MKPFSQELPYGPLWDDGETILLHEPPARLRGAPPSRFALGALWRLTPIAVELAGAETLTAFAARALEPLRSAPVGSVLSGHMRITRGRAIDAWERYREPPFNTWEQLKLDAIRSGLPHHARGMAHTLAEIDTLVALRMPIRQASASDIARALREQAPVFRALCASLETHYGGLRMAPRRLQGQAIVDALTYGLYPETPITHGLDESLPLSRQIVTASPELTPQRVRMGQEAEATVLSAIRYPAVLPVGALSSPRPPSPDAPLLAPWTWSDDPVVVSVLAACIDPHELLAYVERRQGFTLRQEDRRREDAVTDASVARGAFAQAAEALHLGEPFVDVSAHLVLWHAPGEGLGLQVAAQRAAREVGLALHAEDQMAGDIFLRALPLAYNPEFPKARDMARSEPVTNAYAGALMPVYGGYGGADRHHHSYAVNRRGEGVTLDVFDRMPPHAIICGQSGSGKSILANWLLSDCLDRGADVFVLDRYGSYNGLAERYGGLVKNVSPSSPIGLGLFDGPLDAEHRSVMVNAVAEIHLAQGDPPLGAAEIAALTAWVKAFSEDWQADRPGQMATLSDFLQHVKDDADGESGAFARRLLSVLSLYAGDGEYASFVDGPNELPMGAGITVLDVEGLDEVKWLQNLLMLLFFHRAYRHIKDPTRQERRKLLVVDECWGMLRSAQSALAVEAYARAFRRLNASLIMITQNLTDFESAVGRVIINNAGRAFLFKLQPEQARCACEQFGLAPHLLPMLSSLVNPDEYPDLDMSEGLFCRLNEAHGDGGLIRLVAPKAWLARIGQSRQHHQEAMHA